MCEYGAYGPAALTVLVDCANADGDMRLLETVAGVNMAHMGWRH